MTIEVYHIHVNTTGKTDIIDLTPKAMETVAGSASLNGVLSLFVPGSTAALTTIEYETGVINDLKNAIERMAPEDLY